MQSFPCGSLQAGPSQGKKVGKEKKISPLRSPSFLQCEEPTVVAGYPCCISLYVYFLQLIIFLYADIKYLFFNYMYITL